MKQIQDILRNFINNNIWTNEDGESQSLIDLTMSEVSETMLYLHTLRDMNNNFDKDETVEILITHSLNKIIEHQQLFIKTEGTYDD